jgi:hypothetical protein
MCPGHGKLPRRDAAVAEAMGLSSVSPSLGLAKTSGIPTLVETVILVVNEGTTPASKVVLFQHSDFETGFC